MPFGAVEDACPYKEKSNFLMRRSLCEVLFVLSHVDKKDANYLFKLLSSSKFLHGYMYEIS